MNQEVILIHPPLWDMYGPPASTAALVGHLRSHGFSAHQIDLNQIYFKDSCNDLLLAALRDATDETTYHSKLPYEHKVVLGAREFMPDLLEAKGISHSDLTFEAYRRNITQWELPKLNVMDALIHYGYFCRKSGPMSRLLTNADALTDDIWKRLKRLFEQSCLRRIRSEKPAIVGFSMLGEQQLAPTIACTYWLRQEFEGTIIWGGSDIRYTYQKMQKPESWWRDLPDFLCLGEGESALQRLAELHRRGKARGRDYHRRSAPESLTDNSPVLVTIKGLKDSEVAEAQRIPGLLPAPFLNYPLPTKHYEPVDRLGTYSFDDLDFDSYLMPEPVIPYQASRGCHWGICAFCDHEEGYRLHYRPKTVKQVVDDMEIFRREYGITHLQFVDEAIEPDWFNQFLLEIETRGLAGVYRWSNYSKISPYVTSELLQKAYQLGCRMILFGVETFNQRLLQLVKKGIARDQVFRLVADTKSARIRCWIWLISGLPSQTPKELQEDIRDLESVLPLIDAVSVGRYRISANSDLAREPSAFGIVSYDLESPMDVVCEHNGEIIDPKALADLYYGSYYPLAIEGSRSHNRYLILHEAIKHEHEPVAQPVPPHVLRAELSRNVVAASHSSTLAGPGDL